MYSIYYICIQVLFLESFYQGAEMKYYATVLLIQSCIKTLQEYKQTQQQSEMTPNNPFPTEKISIYLEKLCSTCYINIATASVHRTISIRNRLNEISSSDHAKHKNNMESFVPNNVHDLVSNRCVLRTPLDWCDEGLKKNNSLIGRLRRLFVLEKMYQ